MAKISLTRALAELKTIDDRILRITRDEKFIGVVKGTKQKPFGSTQKTIEELASSIKSSFQSLNDLIDRRKKLKSALVLANSTTKITINNESMTIAEALDLKSFNNLRKSGLASLRICLAAAQKVVNEENAKLEDNILKSLNSIYGNVSDKSKVDPSALASISAPMKAEHEASLFCTFNIHEYIAKTQNDIENFASEIDYVLSEVNSSTFIDL